MPSAAVVTGAELLADIPKVITFLYFPQCVHVQQKCHVNIYYLTEIQSTALSYLYCFFFFFFFFFFVFFFFFCCCCCCCCFFVVFFFGCCCFNLVIDYTLEFSIFFTRVSLKKAMRIL